ncbi:MAG TPA: hypothetical protein VFD71_12965 [Planctomycetota bacterium]|nr:hypothetical protein [Planctomycetota bacterium]
MLEKRIDKRSSELESALMMGLAQAGENPEGYAEQVRLEYAKYLEKRNAIRKARGRVRRSGLPAHSAN